MDEGELRTRVDQARSGDPEAFGELFRCLEPDVRRLCTRLLGSKQESEDAASEVFLRARRSLESYDPRQPFRRWLLAIAAHLCVDRLRRRSTEARLFDPHDADPAESTSPAPSPLQGMLRAEARREVLAAIEALPDRYRTPITLRYYAELDYATLGEMLGVSRNQVATLLFRARRLLREALSERVAGEPRP